MNDNVKNLIGWWKIRGEEEGESFIKFFIFYLCFDAWITAESGEDQDSAKMRWFHENDNCLKRNWEGIRGGQLMQSWLRGLQKSSPVVDMRPHSSGPVYLTDINNIDEIVDYIYQIRCNLFHGAKSYMDPRDRELVHNSSRVLEKWLQWSYEKCLKN